MTFNWLGSNKVDMRRTTLWRQSAAPVRLAQEFAALLRPVENELINLSYTTPPALSPSQLFLTPATPPPDAPPTRPFDTLPWSVRTLGNIREIRLARR